MTCDQDAFYIREEYAAFEGDTEVSSSSRRYEIPREGV